MPAIIGRKLGMTQVFTEDGTVVPVTVIEAGPCPVTAIREPERDGYSAVQLAFGEVAERKLSKAELGISRRPVQGRCGPWSSSATRSSRGRGSEDRRHGHRRVLRAGTEDQGIGGWDRQGLCRHDPPPQLSPRPVSHGSHNVRAPGSIGASADPARVFKGTRMPGRLGGGRVTQLGLEVFQIDAERNLLLVKGSVPGSRNGVVEVRGGVRPRSWARRRRRPAGEPFRRGAAPVAFA